MYNVTNPATGETIEEFATATDEEMREAINRAHRGYADWRTRTIADRAAILLKAADMFNERTDDLAEIITVEMGKRIDEARGELDITADIFRYYATEAERLLADEPLDIEGGKAVIKKSPIGVIIGIMPWNYPYYQVARFAAPNLVLGNTALLKHAPSCPRSSAAVEQVLRDAGLPEDAYINIYATNEQIAWMLADPRIQGISLTGSERAGTAVAAEAGKHLKKVVLELGGSDPMIILDSSDIVRTAREAAQARMGNTGQACNAPKRMIVLDPIYDEFVDRLSTEMAAYTPGDPMDPATTLAPLSSGAAADRLTAQIDRAREQGATIRVGGVRIPGPGAYVQATVITDVTPEMDAYHEELFGPVAVVYRAGSIDEAVTLANDTPYGLGAAVFSDDRVKAAEVGARIDAGMVYVNQAGGSQPDLPFGGIKRSGLGRELGPLGIEEFMNKKVIRL